MTAVRVTVKGENAACEAASVEKKSRAHSVGVGGMWRRGAAGRRGAGVAFVCVRFRVLCVCPCVWRCDVRHGACECSDGDLVA